MERKTGKLIGCLCGALFLVQGATAWGVTLSTENNIDFFPVPGITSPTFSSTLGITFGNINTTASGNLFSNGVNVNAQAVGATSQTGTGSFVTGIDGSTGLNGSYYQSPDGNRFAQLNTQVTAPAVPGSNPVDSDFVVLGSTRAAVQSGMEGRARAEDTALYSQNFTIGGQGAAGSLQISADYMFNFLLEGFNAATDSVLGQGRALFTLALNGGAPVTLFDSGLFTATLAQMDRTDLLNPNGLFNSTMSVTSGDTGIFTAQAFTVSEVSSVPEPGTFLLVGSGILGIFLIRRKARS